MYSSIESWNDLSRRNLLRYGLATIRETLRQTTDQPVEPSVIATLSAYMGNAADRLVPDEATERTKQHLLDTIASMISGIDLPPGRMGLKFIESYRGSGSATVAGSGVSCGPLEAAMANAMLAHSDETDDSHAPSQSHPGCGVIPAALAAAEHFAIDGTHLLRAIALGYDVGTRVSMTLGGEDYQTHFHRDTHSICTVFGAGAAAACAAKLNAQQMRWVLDYSAQQASGIAAWQRDTHHVEKALVFGGFAARDALSTALLIHAGATGVNDVLSGPDNFFLAFKPEADPQGLIDKLGERYEVTRTNIKKWTVGSPIQAVLDALELLLHEHPVKPADVREVVVRIGSGEAHIVDNRDMPDISLQHMVAVMITDGTVTFRSAHDQARMQDSGIQKLRSQVRLVYDDGLQRLYPVRVAVVEITTTDGKTYSKRVDAVRGSAENPMSTKEVVTKAQDLISPILGTERSGRLIEAVLKIEKISNVRFLGPMLRRA
ncbi:MAG TPA: MmgE/PrpD family protein [Terracidiphilus sp.]|jgi:2-methylcitrate dehydratase PrpD